ncbi:MAG: hypothetical protein HOH66_18070 [Rhodospirillaceae bacterium]|jgi:hypothetical protein|nr:hypothetical protein [Rhodospirillaceae bacterium]
METKTLEEDKMTADRIAEIQDEELTDEALDLRDCLKYSYTATNGICGS